MDIANLYRILVLIITSKIQIRNFRKFNSIKILNVVFAIDFDGSLLRGTRLDEKTDMEL